MARLLRQELVELIESVEKGGGDATDLKALLAEVGREQKRGVGGRLRDAAPHGGLQSTRDEEMTMQERLECKVGNLFFNGITSEVLKKLVEMDRDHTLKELKRMCCKAGLSPNGDKKILAAKLLADSNLHPGRGEKKEEAGNPSTICGRLTPPLMEEIEEMVKAVEWPPPEEPTTTFSAVLQVIDYAFPIKNPQMKCLEQGVSKSGDKKKLAARLLLVKEEEVTALAERTIAELKARGIENGFDMTLEEVTDIARKVVGT